jgi:hypothetical protein
MRKNAMMKIVSLVAILVHALPLMSADPLISDVPDQVIPQDSSTTLLYLTVGDSETSFSGLVVTATSSNSLLVPNDAAHLTIAGTTAQRTIAVTPLAGQTGSTTVTMLVTDGDGATSDSSFILVVTPPNTSPVVSGIPGHFIIYKDKAADQISISVSDAESPAELLVLSATSSNIALVGNDSIRIDGTGSSRQVTISASPGQVGVSVLRFSLVDPLGASQIVECIFSVIDPGSPNASIRQPGGLYILDGEGGSQVAGVSMRDGNVRDYPFVDGYVLRTSWETLEPTDGHYDFTIIDNLLSPGGAHRLPGSQRLSLIIGSSSPAWLLSLPVSTWTAGNPAVTKPLPWDPLTQQRFAALLDALAAHESTPGTSLRDDPLLAAINCGIAGLKSGIRDPEEIKIRDMPGYSRQNILLAVDTHLGNVTKAFPDKPVHIGFWAYNDAVSDPAAWDELRTSLLAAFNGADRPRIGFWMENLAANRIAADSDPYEGLPNTDFAAALFTSQEEAYVGYQMLGSWAKPFNPSHVDNTLNGSPEDALDYSANVFQSRYFEVYVADADFMPFADELQRWHDFLADLPRADAGVIRFSATAVDIAEGSPETGNAVVVTVLREGGSSGAISVAYKMTGDTASSGVDFVAHSGTLTWVDGDSSSRSIVIDVVGDGATEGTESLVVSLAGPTGGAVVDPVDWVLVNIIDDDAIALPSAPAIVVQPASANVALGQAAAFSVSANGTAPLSYQWRKDGVDIAGATAASLSIPSVASVDFGIYDVVVANVAGTTISDGASLTAPAPAPAADAVVAPIPATAIPIGSTGSSGGSSGCGLGGIGALLATAGLAVISTRRRRR